MGDWGTQRIVKKLFGDRQAQKSVVEAMTLIFKYFNHRMEIPPLYTDEELAALTMPTLFIGGTKDVLRDSVKIADRLRSQVANLTVDLVHGGGHAMNDTIDTILPFLLTDKSLGLKS